MQARARVLEQREIDTVSDTIEVCNKYTEEKWQTSPRPTYTTLTFYSHNFRFKQKSVLACLLPLREMFSYQGKFQVKFLQRCPEFEPLRFWPHSEVCSDIFADILRALMQHIIL